MNGTQHVFVGRKVIKAQVLDRSGKSTDCGGIAVKLVLGVRDANLHEPQLFMHRSRVPRLRARRSLSTGDHLSAAHRS